MLHVILVWKNYIKVCRNTLPCVNYLYLTTHCTVWYIICCTNWQSICFTGKSGKSMKLIVKFSMIVSLHAYKKWNLLTSKCVWGIFFSYCFIFWQLQSNAFCRLLCQWLYGHLSPRILQLRTWRLHIVVCGRFLSTAVSTINHCRFPLLEILQCFLKVLSITYFMKAS